MAASTFAPTASLYPYIHAEKYNHRLLSLKVPNVKFNFNVSFSTLLQPCKQHIELLICMLL